MHLDLLDLLRCPAAHETTPLVAAADAVAGRDLRAGALGCPACDAVYAVRDGTLHLGPPGARVSARGDADRLAALLAIDDAPGVFVVDGAWGAAAAGVAAPAARLVALDTESGRGLDGVVGVADRFPFADGSVRGIALGDPRRVADAPRVLRPGGRLLAPAAVPVPAGVVELARDAQDWVAETPALARLARAPRRP